MPLISYMDKRLSDDRVKIIDQANKIIAEFAADGYALTLRQLFYQFVSRDVIPNNTKSYKRLGDIISDGRMLGLIDWDAINDRLRELREMPTWEHPSKIVLAAAQSFRIDLWDDKWQKYRPEVWVEKDAMGEIVERAARIWRTPVMVCRGYMSQSAIWEAGHKRFRVYDANGQTPVVIHLGDHDPSGMDMSRDIRDRLETFSGCEVEVRRIALNMDQIKQYNPPPNPAKLTDSRSTGYIDQFGGQSWELDALEPRVLDQLIQQTIQEFVDKDAWEEAEDKEAAYRKSLNLIADNYAAIVKTYAAFADDDDTDEDDDDTN